MKKILSKFDRNEKLENSHNTSSSKETNSFVGKVFTVGRVTVTVEDVLAEGKWEWEWVGAPLMCVSVSLYVSVCVCAVLHFSLPPDLKFEASQCLRLDKKNNTGRKQLHAALLF